MIPEWKRRKLEAVEKLRQLDAGYEPDVDHRQKERADPATPKTPMLERINERDIERFKL